MFPVPNWTAEKAAVTDLASLPWSDPNSDPIGDIRTAMEQIRNAAVPATEAFKRFAEAFGPPSENARTHHLHIHSRRTGISAAEAGRRLDKAVMEATSKPPYTHTLFSDGTMVTHAPFTVKKNNLSEIKAHLGRLPLPLSKSFGYKDIPNA